MKKRFLGQDAHGRIYPFTAEGTSAETIEENLRYGCGCGEAHGKLRYGFCDKRFVRVEEVEE